MERDSTLSGQSATATITVTGSAAVSGNNLSVALTGGDYAGGTGTFAK